MSIMTMMILEKLTIRLEYAQRHAVNLLVSDLLRHPHSQADTDVTCSTTSNVTNANVTEITNTTNVTKSACQSEASVSNSTNSNPANGSSEVMKSGINLEQQADMLSPFKSKIL